MKPLVFQNPKIQELPSATALDLRAATSANASLNMPHGMAPSSPANGDVWTTTAGIFVRINGVTVGPLSSGGGGASVAWTLAGSWTFSSNVAHVDFTGLSTYNELLFIARNVTGSASGVRSLTVSVDNGANFFSATGDYVNVSPTGIESGTTVIAGHSTVTALARSFAAHVVNTKGAVKLSIMQSSTATQILFVASALDINALRLNNTSAGVETGNLTGGTAYVFAR